MSLFKGVVALEDVPKAFVLNGNVKFYRLQRFLPLCGKSGKKKKKKKEMFEVKSLHVLNNYIGSDL